MRSRFTVYFMLLISKYYYVLNLIGTLYITFIHINVRPIFIFKFHFLHFKAGTSESQNPTSQNQDGMEVAAQTPVFQNSNSNSNQHQMMASVGIATLDNKENIQQKFTADAMKVAAMETPMMAESYDSVMN